MKHKLLLFTALCISLGSVFAQTPDSLQTANVPAQGAPIPVELFAGNQGFNFQLILSKQFSPTSKFGFFNVTSFASGYKQANQTTSFISQSGLTAEVGKGISVMAGLSAMSFPDEPMEVRPTAGLQYLLFNRDFSVFVLPRFDLTQTYNFETLAVLEYKPMLSKNWGIYTRAEGLYNYNTKLGYHDITEINLRLGLSYKNVQFGIGSILDFYGPGSYNVNNFGLFIKTDLF
jgi:hypothetical protein